MPTRSAIQTALSNPARNAPAIERLGGDRLATRPDGTIASPHSSDVMVVRVERGAGQSIALRIPLAEDGDPGSMAVHAAFATDPVINRLRSLSPSPIAGGVSVIPGALLFPEGRDELRPHPAIAMEWIGDATLGDLVRRLIATNDLLRLSNLSTTFTRLMQTLGNERFSHGDLEPSNIVLRRADGMAIVDYDSAAWPGSPRGRAAQPRGAYRHPSNKTPVVVERRDDFATLVMLVSLRALAIDTGMLFPHSLHPEHGLVLSARDFQDPAHSERFRRLATIDDPETVALSAILAEACRKPIDEVPPFEEALRAAKAVTGRARRASQARKPRSLYESSEEAQPGNRLSSRDRQLRLTRLNAMLLANADEAALSFWESSGLSDDPVAIEQVGDLMQEARVRIEIAQRPPAPPEPEPPRYDPRRDWRMISAGASMARLEQAIAVGDRAAVLNEWPDVRDLPGASRYAPAVHQVASDYWSDTIQHAARRNDAGSVLEAVDRADGAGVPIPAGLRPLIRAARERLEAEDSTVADGVNWEERFPQLARAIREESDRQIVTALAWESPDALTFLPDAPRFRADLALRRIEWADSIREALRHRDAAGLLELTSHPVPGAESLLGPTELARVERERERAAAQAELNEALRGTSNREFVRAMRRMEQCSAELPHDLDRRAFTEAIDRITRLTALRRAVTDPDKDARTIARLVPGVMMRGADWATVERLVNVGDVDRELVKSARVERIREALKTGNDSAIAAAAMPDPHDVIAELTDDERVHVEQALETSRPLAGRISSMLMTGPRRPTTDDAALDERDDAITPVD